MAFFENASKFFRCQEIFNALTSVPDKLLKKTMRFLKPLHNRLVNKIQIPSEIIKRTQRQPLR